MNRRLPCIMPTRRAPCESIRKIEPRLEPISPKRVYDFKMKIDQVALYGPVNSNTPSHRSTVLRVIVCTFLRVKSCG